MNRSVQRYLEAATGLTNLTATKAEQVVKQMVKSGEAAGDQVGDLVDDLLDRQRKNRDAVAALVRSETVRAVRAMGLATTSEMERLQKQVADMKRELARVQREASAPASGDTGERGDETTAKKTTAKKTAAKKTTATSTPAKKATKKTSPAKKATKKTAPAKKSTATSTPAKKATKKTSPAKKATKKTAKKTAKKTTKKSTS